MRSGPRDVREPRRKWTACTEAKCRGRQYSQDCENACAGILALQGGAGSQDERMDFCRIDVWVDCLDRS